MNRLKKVIEAAQRAFRAHLEALLVSGGMSEEQYVRYLSMQYHLTKGIQRHFFQIAGNPELTRRRAFRKFLINFANEEELHFEIAKNDLKNMNRLPLECPLDVTLWWAYFDSVVASRPFVRLGATVILENIAGPSKDVIQKIFSRAPFVTDSNCQFFAIQQQEAHSPHGDQLLQALTQANLEPAHWDELKKGAEIASVLYLRMVEWAMLKETNEEEKNLAAAA
jgi:hypothetical protein